MSNPPEKRTEPHHAGLHGLQAPAPVEFVSTDEAEALIASITRDLDELQAEVDAAEAAAAEIESEAALFDPGVLERATGAHESAIRAMRDRWERTSTSVAGQPDPLIDLTRSPERPPPTPEPAAVTPTPDPTPTPAPATPVPQVGAAPAPPPPPAVAPAGPQAQTTEATSELLSMAVSLLRLTLITVVVTVVLVLAVALVA